MINLSKHTADEMQGRGILLSYIEAALTSPDRLTQDATDPALRRSYKVIPKSETACFAWSIALTATIYSW
jgi:hypothetical protein